VARELLHCVMSERIECGHAEQPFICWTVPEVIAYQRTNLAACQPACVPLACRRPFFVTRRPRLVVLESLENCSARARSCVLLRRAHGLRSVAVDLEPDDLVVRGATRRVRSPAVAFAAVVRSACCDDVTRSVVTD